MVKNLKSFASFGNKRYDRGVKYFSTKVEVIKEANKQKKMGKNIIRDNNSKGHFLWINIAPKSKSKKKASIKKTLAKTVIGKTEGEILNYLRYKSNMKKEKHIRTKINKEDSIQSSLDSLKSKKLIYLRKISRYYGSEPISHYAISIKGEKSLKSKIKLNKKKVTRKELHDKIENNLEKYFPKVVYYRKDRTTYHTTRYDIGDISMSRKTKKELETIIKNAKNKNYQHETTKKYMTI